MDVSPGVESALLSAPSATLVMSGSRVDRDRVTETYAAMSNCLVTSVLHASQAVTAPASPLIPFPTRGGLVMPEAACFISALVVVGVVVTLALLDVYHRERSVLRVANTCTASVLILSLVHAMSFVIVGGVAVLLGYASAPVSVSTMIREPGSSTIFFCSATGAWVCMYTMYRIRRALKVKADTFHCGDWMLASAVTSAMLTLLTPTLGSLCPSLSPLSGLTPTLCVVSLFSCGGVVFFHLVSHFTLNRPPTTVIWMVGSSVPFLASLYMVRGVMQTLSALIGSTDSPLPCHTIPLVAGSVALFLSVMFSGQLVCLAETKAAWIVALSVCVISLFSVMSGDIGMLEGVVRGTQETPLYVDVTPEGVFPSVPSQFGKTPALPLPLPEGMETVCPNADIAIQCKRQDMSGKKALFGCVVNLVTTAEECTMAGLTLSVDSHNAVVLPKGLGKVQGLTASDHPSGFSVVGDWIPHAEPLSFLVAAEDGATTVSLSASVEYDITLSLEEGYEYGLVEAGYIPTYTRALYTSETLTV
ncbi:hypothetical protein KIPB_006754 [Kipferlia bialata]|uniref:Transmembrane protein n=1 Tax=Kipferlia bialata TaxID=797122 RepID=A0A9K3CXG1_9EUKA|nr:hypothetical protein KIPB_006754 [Kipferlia bialata]|eukprot:g6754.t1